MTKLHTLQKKLRSALKETHRCSTNKLPVLIWTLFSENALIWQHVILSTKPNHQLLKSLRIFSHVCLKCLCYFLWKGIIPVNPWKVPPATKVDSRVNLWQSNTCPQRAFQLGPSQRSLFRCAKHWATSYMLTHSSPIAFLPAPIRTFPALIWIVKL